MIHGELQGQKAITLKIGPEDSKALQLAVPEIKPGYHMNKNHWITVYPGKNLDKQLIIDLVTESYLLVVAKLPKANRPIDLETFLKNQ